MNARAAALGVVAVAALAVAGCGPTVTGKVADRGEPSASGTPSASATPTRSGSPTASPSPREGRSTSPTTPAGSVRLQVTGGFVGKNDVLTVDGDGAWTYQGRSGTKHGTLTAAQHDRLTALVTDPKLANEARLRMPKNMCADGVSYRLTVGSLTLTRVNCGGSAQTPTFNAIVELLGKATPI
ncbi:hypothetical protein [Actinocatenispora comari]|uniref:hypothetical protein n=1 Tax=Actinocatenispora comari TaxID=2807577 RepID=UPI001A90D42B|nr:hypothetical protein [Actinocatenispora comari]